MACPVSADGESRPFLSFLRSSPLSASLLETLQHRIRRGDSLYSLSKQYQTSIPSLMAANSGA